MVLSIIFLEDKHTILLHLSIFYEYQQFFQHRICFSIQPPDYSDPWPKLARSTSFFLIMLFKYCKLDYVPKQLNNGLCSIDGDELCLAKTNGIRISFIVKFVLICIVLNQLVKCSYILIFLITMVVTFTCTLEFLPISFRWAINDGN